MNFKTTIVIVLVSVLTTAICSASGGSDEYMPYRQLLRELRKKGTGVRRRLDQVYDQNTIISSREIWRVGVRHMVLSKTLFIQNTIKN